MFAERFFPDHLPTWALLVELALAGLVVIMAGTRLTRLADTIADRLNLGAGWVGLVFLATVTSLPELVTGGTATAIGNVDLALGGILGSCSFNIFIIFLLNALWGGGSVLRGVSMAHAQTSAFGVLLIGLALFGMVLMEKFAHQPTVAQVTESAWALSIVFTYFFCIRLVYRYEKSQDTSTMEGGQPARRGRVEASVTAQAIAVTLVLVSASWWLARIGDTLSRHEIEMIGRPLGATFVGAGFLAIATSLPEIVTSIAAVRLGKLDLALGNIFGSNMFNILVIPFLKGISLFRGESVMLAHQSTQSLQNLITGLLAVLLTAVAIGGLAYQSQRRVFRRFGFDSVLIAAIYLGGMFLLLSDSGTTGSP